jgi:hypothetical protein
MIILIISSIRWERGTDWESYLNYFQSTPSARWQNFELGYAWLTNITKFIFGNNFTIFLTICAIIIFVYQGKTLIYFNGLNKYKFKLSRAKLFLYEKNSFSETYSILMLLGIYSINIGNIFVVRSTIAYIILFYSSKFIKEKNIKLFLLCILIATLFHRTAIIFVFAYYIFNYVSIDMLVIFNLLIGIPSMFFLKRILLKISNYIGFGYGNKIKIYLSRNASSSSLAVVNILLLSTLFYMLYYYFRVNKRNFNTNFYFVKLFYFGSLITYFSYFHSPYFYRLATPYTIYQVVVIPFFLKITNNKFLKKLIFFLIIIYFFLGFLSTITDYWDLYVPFKTIFNKDMDVKVY